MLFNCTPACRVCCCAPRGRPALRSGPASVPVMPPTGRRGLASARVVSRARPLPRGRPGPFWPVAPFVFQEGSFLSFVQPFMNTELIQIRTQTPPPPARLHPVDQLGTHMAPTPSWAHGLPAWFPKQWGSAPASRTGPCWRDSLVSSAGGKRLLSSL